MVGWLDGQASLFFFANLCLFYLYKIFYQLLFLSFFLFFPEASLLLDLLLPF